MRFDLCVFAALAAMLFSSCTKQADTLQQQIDDLSSGRIATLEEQQDNIEASLASLSAADEALTKYVAALEGQIKTMSEAVAADQSTVAAIQQAVNAVKASQDALQQSMANLVDYLDTGFDGVRGWASGTFATLEQHAALCESLAKVEKATDKNAEAIEKLRAEIVTECKGIVKDAVKDVEQTIRDWVNEKLTGYWTIAQTQARLDSLGSIEKADSAALAASIAQAKTDLTAAYTAAISTAITTLEGKLNAKLAADIKTASDALDAKIMAIDTRLKAAESSITQLLNQIQSITPLPYYSDGAQQIGGFDADTSMLEYIILPDSVAQKVAKNKSLFTVRYTETKMRLSSTKSNTVTTLSISSVAYSDGKVKVSVKNTDLPSGFFSGEGGVCACLVIEGDGNSRASQYVPLAYKAGFSVSKTTKVAFSTGNVQYQASTGTWRFAEHQYDYIGNAAGNNTAEASRSTQSDWIDLFGWGATGFNTYSEKPYSIATNDSKYKTQEAAAFSEKLTIANKGDWGYCINGDAGGWRLMTADECKYLLNSRTNAASKLGCATVASIKGLIILPDVFTDPKVNTSSKSSGGAFVPKATTGYDANIYDAAAWEKMEKAGAVFLPAGGLRNGASVSDAGSCGYYWLSSASSAIKAYYVFFNSYGVYRNDFNRYYGRSVRPVAESN